MANNTLKYTCSECGTERPRSEFITKRVQFKDMGTDGKVITTRTVAWLCKAKEPATGKSCWERDPDFGRAAWLDAPGTRAKRKPEDEHAEA